MSDNVIQTSFAAGELSPALLGRVDFAKYHVGAAKMLNFFVDYRGGASTRPGTQYIGAPAGSSTTRIVPFVFSNQIGQSYLLVFSDFKLRFIKNPGGSAPINGSNAGFILSGMSIYEINTPYAATELFRLKFSQSADIMNITSNSYPWMQLKRFSDTNWTLTPVSIGTNISPPTSGSITITAAPMGSTDPGNTTYLYTVTSVSLTGEESNINLFLYATGINIAATQGTVTINWGPVAGAAYYKVYKAVPSPGGVIQPLGSDLGFVGFSYGTQFTDSNIVADFAHTPPKHSDPFPGQGAGHNIIGYTITNPGSGYANDATDIVITDSSGGGAFIVPIFDNNTHGATAAIVGLAIINQGFDFTAPSISASGSGSGFAATAILGPTSQFPNCSAFFQQRLILAGTPNNPVTIWGSKPGFYSNFDASNPVIDKDSYQFTLAAQLVTRILHMIPMPGGLVIFTDAGVSQLTGGSSGVNNPLAVTPSSAVIVPQSFYGATDVRPITINYEMLFPTSSGLVINLSYNFFANIFTGTDISLLSNHLFAPRRINDWAYQETPHKIVWACRDDGKLLSLTYLKEQDVYGWAQHDSGSGFFESVATLQEGNEIATYFCVVRDGTRSIERLAGRNLEGGISDAWCLDCALSTPVGGGPVSSITLSHLIGKTVYALADGVVRGPFVVPGSGVVTLPVPATKIVAGLPFTADLQSLYLDVGAGETGTIQGKRKVINTISVRVKDSVGLKMGTDFDSLTTFRPGLSSTDPVQPAPPGLTTGDMRINVDSRYSVPAQMCVRQDQPLPATVLALIPEIVVGDSR